MTSKGKGKGGKGASFFTLDSFSKGRGKGKGLAESKEMALDTFRTQVRNSVERLYRNFDRLYKTVYAFEAQNKQDKLEITREMRNGMQKLKGSIQSIPKKIEDIEKKVSDLQLPFQTRPHPKAAPFTIHVPHVPPSPPRRVDDIDLKISNRSIKKETTPPKSKLRRPPTLKERLKSYIPQRFKSKTRKPQYTKKKSKKSYRQKCTCKKTKRY